MAPHRGAEVLVAWLHVCSEVFQGQTIGLCRYVAVKKIFLCVLLSFYCSVPWLNC